MERLDFSERLRVVLADAREEAARRRHEHAGSEHLLLALLHEEREGVPLPGTLRAIDALGVSREELRRAIESTLLAERAVVASPDVLDAARISYTGRAREALATAGAEARMLRNDSVEPEHLLLALTSDDGGAAASLLAALGVTAERVRSALVRQRR